MSEQELKQWNMEDSWSTQRSGQTRHRICGDVRDIYVFGFLP